MGIRIIADSCCDMTKEMVEQIRPLFVPFIVNVVNGSEYVDNGSHPITDLIAELAACKDGAKSTCPSPDAYLSRIDQCGDDDCFIITISSQLSGSYNSACVARNMALEKYPNKKIHVFDSKSAVVAETQIALFLHEQIQNGASFQAITNVCEEYLRQMRTFFVLEDLNNLFKNGRLAAVASRIVTMVKLCPIMGEDGEGHIKLISPSLGIDRSLRKLVDIVAQRAEQAKTQSIHLLIGFCNCLERAEKIKDRILKKCPTIKEITLVPTGILSTMYANNGGIVIAF